ncbi:TerC family protein, partial [Streptomyces sp. TRM76130]|nr:TerC family protein [Streptomyces sp. TRM76130]
SNAFAILGLRALYFLLSGLLDRFHYLSKGLALILSFIGVKLILQASHKLFDSDIPEIPSPISLAVIATILAVSVVLSLRRPTPSGGTGSVGGGEDDAAHDSAGGRPSARRERDAGDPPVQG